MLPALALRSDSLDERGGDDLSPSLVLVTNLLGDLGNAIGRGDYRTLIGLPIGGALICYLYSRRVRDVFGPGVPASSKDAGSS